MKVVRSRKAPSGAFARWAIVVVAALMVAGCAGSPVTRSGGGRHPSEAKYGVASSPRVIPEGMPIPKGGGRDMTGQPYVVAGRTYVPRPGRGYNREGWASWYGTAFHGRLTANGEIFDRESVAAAHPTLPLPSYVRVTNLLNKRSMIVRVNDRGPYEQDRVIDLSERAAEALDFRRRGVARVRVEYVGRASLDGSDDGKLLASLRHDGGPASLGERPREYASAAPARVEREDRAETRSSERAERREISRDRPVRAGAARDAEPLDIRPPSRPSFASNDEVRRASR